jgi:hypothetical protein
MNHILPYQYDGTKDYSTKIIVAHFDHQGIVTNTNRRSRSTTKGTTNGYRNRKNDFRNILPHQQRHGDGNGRSRNRKIKTNHKYHYTIEYGRPNVVVVHHSDGIYVYALRNGRSMCHISFQSNTNTLYTDLDHDGIMDTIQFMTRNPFFNSNTDNYNLIVENYNNNITPMMDAIDVIAQGQNYDSIASELVRNNLSITHDHPYNDDNNNNTRTAYPDYDAYIKNQQLHQPCHIYITSGYPIIMDTMVSDTFLCFHDYNNQLLSHGPFLLVDGYKNNNNKQEYGIIFAFNNGIIGRMNSINTIHGNWDWVRSNHHNNNNDIDKTNDRYPTWDSNDDNDDNTSIILLQQLYINHERNMDNPIVLVTHDRITLLSVMTGHIMTSYTLPQTSIVRPYIMDINQDGTSDLIIVTKDAIWGYIMIVRTTTNNTIVLYHILIGILIMGFMLAYLRNRFGPNPGQRSTDL